MLEYKYKHKEEDFRVNEILNIITDGGIYNYYMLRKKGFRTVDVIDLLVKKYNIEIGDITYAGLKDEDAITLQYIAIKGKKIDNCKEYSGAGQYELNYVGSSEYPIEIGKLQGNSFKLRLRNLDDSVAKKIKNYEKHLFTILNYFDVQRFGMPGKKHITHLIGKNIIENKYDEAFEQLLISGNIDENTYHQWKSHAKDYINRIEPRRRTFFLSAYDSYVWNRVLGEAVEKQSSGLLYEKSGISFFYSDKVNDLIRNEIEKIPIIWHRYTPEGEIFETESFRQPYISLIYRAAEVQDDNEYLGRYMLDIDFVLPAGSYATNAVDQLMYILERK